MLGIPQVPGGLAPLPPMQGNQPSVPAGVSPLAAQLNPSNGLNPLAPQAAGVTAPPISGPVETATGPAETAVKVRKPRTPRARYRAADAPKLTAVPTDYSAKKHLPMGKDDFESGATFYDFKADQSKKTVAKYEQLAREEREGGSAETRTQKKKIEKAVKLVQDLEPALRASMGDEAFEAMMRNMSAAPAANAAATAAGV